MATLGRSVRPERRPPTLPPVADERSEPPIHFVVPVDLQAGAFSDVVSIWHTAHGFTMDFAVIDRTVRDEDGNSFTPAFVVSRMKIPATVVFQIARAIADNVRAYEDVYGSITPLPVDGSVIPPVAVEQEEDSDEHGDEG